MYKKGSLHHGDYPDQRIALQLAIFRIQRTSKNILYCIFLLEKLMCIFSFMKIAEGKLVTSFTWKMKMPGCIFLAPTFLVFVDIGKRHLFLHSRAFSAKAKDS